MDQFSHRVSRAAVDLGDGVVSEAVVGLLLTLKSSRYPIGPGAFENCGEGLRLML
jgi:hypothetical protein